MFQTDGIKAGTPLRVEKQQEGYHTLWQTVIAQPEVLLTPIPRKNNLSLELDWTAGQLQGAGATLRWYPVPDWIMVNFSEYLYTQVPAVPNASLPHPCGLGAAGWDCTCSCRPNRGSGSASRLASGPSSPTCPGEPAPIFTDVYLNLLSLWGEWRMAGIPMFSRIELKVPLGCRETTSSDRGRRCTGEASCRQ